MGVGRTFVAQARRLGSYLKHHFESEEERARAAFHAAARAGAGGDGDAGLHARNLGREPAEWGARGFLREMSREDFERTRVAK